MDKTTRPTVASIEAWKNRPAEEIRARLARENVLLVTRAQKQAALLRLITSDDISESDLDAMIHAATAVVSARPFET
jgi:hypothetical protein